MTPRTSRPRRVVRGVLRGGAAAVVPAVVAGLVACSVSAGEPDGESSSSSTVSVSPTTTQRPATMAEYEAQSIEWGSCDRIQSPEGSTKDGFVCGSLLVPLDYADLAKGSLRVVVNRRPARADRKGAIVVNRGGPGLSGVDYAFYDTFVLSAAVVQDYDLVGFDPRGVARSAGIRCLDDQEREEFLAADPTPRTVRARTRNQALLSTLVSGCRREAPVAALMDTASAARDLDILRSALGEDQLNYLGKSYGTQLGAAYAELFPTRVGRFVLDGAVTPRIAGDPATVSAEQLAAIDVALRAFATDCLDRSDCPLDGPTVDGAVDQIVQLLRTLERAPLPTDDADRPLTEGLGTTAVFATLYERNGWNLLRQGLTEAFSGQGQSLLVIADLYGQRRPDGTYRGNGIEAQTAVTCLDRDPARPPRDPAAEQAQLVARVPDLAPLVDLTVDPCDSWPFPARGSTPVVQTPTSPILVIGTTRDPATPYYWATELATALGSGVLLTFDGDGHTAYLTDGAACVDALVDAYFLTGDVPADGTRCVATYE